MKELFERSVAEHIEALERGEYTSLELTRTYLDRIRERDAHIGAFLTVTEERALDEARASDERRRKGCLKSPLDGIPYALKDNYSTKGIRTTCASRMLEDYIPPFDATVVERLHDCGCVLLGKLNMDELAMGSTNERSAFYPVRNPHNTDHVPGGSSGGSAAAVAAGEAPFALGSDTGGSVRQPAAFCGVYGLRPTYGLVSRYGVAEFASSMDCVGLVTRSAADCERILSAIAGYDERDATTRTDTMRPALNRVARVAVILPREGEGYSESVRGAVFSAIDRLKAGGLTVETVELPSPEAALAAYCVISSAEASSNLARFDGIRFGHRSEQTQELSALYGNSRSEGFGREVKKRILFGTWMLTEENRNLYYRRAEQVRATVSAAFASLFERYDLLLSPMTPTTAFRLGERLSAAEQRQADLCAVYAALSGFPAVSVPFGRDERGLPVAVQLTARPMEERLLLEVADDLGEV